MWSFLILALCTVVFGQPYELEENQNECPSDVRNEYRETVDDFQTRLFKAIAKSNYDHFVISQHSIWLTLSALAEGAEEPVKYEIFTALGLPESTCKRENYYRLATNIETPGDDVLIGRNRMIVFDEAVKVNESWAEAVKSSKLIELKYAPLRENVEEAAEKMEEIIGAKTPIPSYFLSGNSVILDSLDYDGMWTHSFRDAELQKAPFYNDRGVSIGNVEYMTMKKHAKIAYLKYLNAKILELPVGTDERYHMLFLINLDDTPLRKTIEGYMSTLIKDNLEFQRESSQPIEIAIPQFTMTTQLDTTLFLEEIGLKSIFADEAATRYVSDPPALPSSLLQRVTLKIGGKGIHPHPQYEDIDGLDEKDVGLEQAAGREFIANRPFMFGLFDSETRTCLLSGAFSGPTRN